MMRVWRLSVWRLSVCLSRTSDISREQRGLGRLKLAHVTRNSDTTFKVKRSKVKVIRLWLAVQVRPTWTYSLWPLHMHASCIVYRVTTCRGHSVAAPLQAAQLVNFWFRRVLDKEFDRVLEPAKARLAQPYTKLGSGTEVNFRLQCAALFCGGVERSMSQNPMKQEAQLMLTTGSTRLAVSRGQQTWYHSTCYI